jgi:6-phosphogluconolactonase
MSTLDTVSRDIAGGSLVVCDNAQALSAAAAQIIEQQARLAVMARSQFWMALSGGSTPLALYVMLAKQPYLTEIPWQRAHIYWGDERCVPPTDGQSNFRAANETLLQHVPVPTQNIHRIEGERGPAAAAAHYREALRQSAPPKLAYPRFDIVLLGLGSDGHTASLFPGVTNEGEDTLAAVPVTANIAGRPAERVTLTPQVYNAAVLVIFLVSGPSKAAALAATLEGPRDALAYPAQRIKPTAGKIVWCVDREAAALLKGI